MNQDKLKIVFFGTPDFAVESLRAILNNGFDVEAVVTATDKVAGRGHKVLSSAVKQFAVERGLRVLQPEKLKDEEFVETLRSIDADLFVVIAFRMLPEVVWTMPRLGTFNLHASLLPRYRGAAPINRAVMNGDTRTGVTTFFLQHEIDTGDIIDRVAIDILPEDNAGTVHDKLMALGAELTVKTIRSIIDGSLKTVPQQEIIEAGTESCPAPKIFKDTCAIDWNRTAVEVNNHIRGLSPYPGAWTLFDAKKAVMNSLSDGNNSGLPEFKIFRAEPTGKETELIPGTVVIEGENLYVACGDRLLRILELQPAGKRRMDASAWLRGARLNG